MIQLPEGFDISLLFSDLFSLAAPFVSISLLIACGMLINQIFKRVP